MQTTNIYDQSQLYSIGYIYKAHRNKDKVKDRGMRIIDMDIHPTGNSLGTIAEDEDVRFWTYPGSGNI